MLLLAFLPPPKLPEVRGPDAFFSFCLRLPKLVLRAGAIAAACTRCAHPLAGVSVQGAPLRHPNSDAGAVADAATGPPYLQPSNLLLWALVRLPNLVPVAGAIAAACPSSAHTWAGFLVQEAPTAPSEISCWSCS